MWRSFVRCCHLKVPRKYFLSLHVCLILNLFCNNNKNKAKHENPIRMSAFLHGNSPSRSDWLTMTSLFGGRRSKNDHLFCFHFDCFFVSRKDFRIGFACFRVPIGWLAGWPIGQRFVNNNNQSYSKCIPQQRVRHCVCVCVSACGPFSRFSPQLSSLPNEKTNKMKKKNHPFFPRKKTR